MRQLDLRRAKGALIEGDRFSHTAHVWHGDDRGDVIEFAFTLPRGVRRETIEAAFRYYGRMWVDRKVKEGWKPNPRSFGCYGPFPSLETPGEDEYIIRARWWREKPLVMSAAQFEALAKVEPQPASYLAILQQAAALPDNREQQEDARRRAAAWRQEVEEKKAWRRSRGLPLVKEVADG